ncbi:MAG TPA: phosphonate ABC transporter substrate-binding protein [Candidatus Marinimicrobia bacterium]|nr:phosphonate ABC transporter substrate-binding protein [Candidatus Neomarinimicrobiota bacterium]
MTDKKIKLAILGGIIGLMLMLTIFIYRLAVNINIPRIEFAESESLPNIAENKPLIWFGVISRYNPQMIYKGYQPLIDYLSEHTPYRFELRLSSDYEESVRQLERGEADLAFLGSLIYARRRQLSHLQCILKPLNRDGEPLFYSALISRIDSPVKALSDLRGKRIALPSRHSWSGNWLLDTLQNSGIAVTELGRIDYFPYHHTVLYQALRGDYDAGVVKDRVWREYSGKDMRVIMLSDAVPGSPIVVRKGVDDALVLAVKKALLAIDSQKPAFQLMLSDWDEEFRNGFAPANDSDYDGLEFPVAQKADADED